jgi:predicted GIY-YIG superfamily endonuclease
MPKFYYVYRLISISSPVRHYVGFTTDLQARLATHNAGKVTHTAKYGPWKIDSAHAFLNENKAIEFEKYLKSHSGREFAKRHF